MWFPGTHSLTLDHRNSTTPKCWRCTVTEANPMSVAELCDPCRDFLLDAGPDPKAMTP